jgi:hypothetical protein
MPSLRRDRLRGPVSACVIAAALAVVALVAPWHAGAGRPKTARAASLFVSPSGSDANACTRAAPCQSFDRAYHVARPGQVVAVLAGSYPTQTITADATKHAPAVVFAPRTAGSVRVKNVTVLGSYIDLDGLTIAGIWYVGVNSSSTAQAAQPHDVVLRDVKASNFFITGASDVSVLGGKIGPTVDNAAQIKGCYQCRYAPQNITIDGVTFRDFSRKTGGKHMECLHVYPAQGLTIRNSRFFNCAIIDLFLENYGAGGDLRDITIENNVFDAPGSHGGALDRGYYALAFEGAKRPITNVRIAYNSLLAGSIPGFDSSATFSNVVVEANVGALNQRFCSAGVTFAYNVWENAKCSASDTTAPSGFADPGHYDFRLRPGAAAINHGDPNRHPATDVDGRLRPRRWAPDAGAYQWETALVVLGKSIGAAAIGEKASAVAAFYGEAASTQAVRVDTRTLEKRVYRVRGGNLWVMTARGKVVGVGTSSPYYETAGAVGPTTGIGKIRRLAQTAWVGCRGAYRRVYAGVPVYFSPKGGRRGATIHSISMTKGDGGCP